MSPPAGQIAAPLAFAPALALMALRVLSQFLSEIGPPVEVQTDAMAYVAVIVPFAFRALTAGLFEGRARPKAIFAGNNRLHACLQNGRCRDSVVRYQLASRRGDGPWTNKLL